MNNTVHTSIIRDNIHRKPSYNEPLCPLPYTKINNKWFIFAYVDNDDKVNSK